tara:strand:+ start:1030 stop:1392 length:363 start_codon:yes stop_codon:yes gene_type:complete
MEEQDLDWHHYLIYFLVFIFAIIASNSFGQITVVHVNADWNSSNNVAWFMDLEECKAKKYILIEKDPEVQKKHKIAVVPTIIIFKDGEEVARFQADLSFKMVATRREVQEEIDNQLMSDF